MLPLFNLHRPGPKLAGMLVLAFLSAPLGACSSFDGFNLFGDKDTQAADEPADKLYNEGLYLLNEKKEYKEAIKRFEEVDRQHPYSEWARKALIMSAFASYEANQYDDCIATAKRYIALHPGTADAAYALYLVGSSDFERIPDITRDQARTEKAMAELDEVARKYPGTEYAVSARKKIEVARDQLAGKEMAIGRFYMEKRNFTGAINRFKIVVTQYQTTRHVEEALMRLAEAYMSLGIVQEAQTAAAVLGHNFPESPWYKDAYNLVKGGGFEPNENRASWMSKAFSALVPG
ncbi:MAG: outer membrane protein assembly factor BamD [Alphaproteobacteria bacterium]|jgi:outer membrane protein assembly factor BamD|nr:outer membrane protein assembly factor BamD [Alphaproteobacteria bacterium]